MIERFVVSSLLSSSLVWWCVDFNEYLSGNLLVLGVHDLSGVLGSSDGHDEDRGP